MSPAQPTDRTFMTRRVPPWTSATPLYFPAPIPWVREHAGRAGAGGRTSGMGYRRLPADVCGHAADRAEQPERLEQLRALSTASTKVMSAN
jgi:CMP-2-keto-3-deoxyoctulosonic acid synthetase